MSVRREKVWAYFTDPHAWGEWYGDVLIAVEPSWTQGALVRWGRAKATLESVTPFEAVTFERHGERVTWSFVDRGDITLVTVAKDLTHTLQLGLDLDAEQRECDFWLQRFASVVDGGSAPVAIADGTDGIAADTLINRPRSDVWTIFTTPDTWAGWYGGPLLRVEPPWQPGSTLTWAAGPASSVRDFEAGRIVRIVSSSGVVTTWTFSDAANGTRVAISTDYSNSGLTVTDVDAVRLRLRKQLKGLQAYAERTGTPGSTASAIGDGIPADRTWKIGGMSVGVSKPVAIFWLIVIVFAVVYSVLAFLNDCARLHIC
jgi:uncharacterized protein YndB with AHSA1/START domain